MKIVVCIKRVPQTAEADVKIDSTEKDIVKDRLNFDMNESDTYALEEAILLKEKFNGELTAITVGPPESEDTLRIALAKGADQAIRIKTEDFGELDGFKTAQLLKTAIKDLDYDLILTGCLATDDYYALVGVTLAELLDISHATLVTKIELDETQAHVNRELEGGLIEHLQISLPALFTIQTGINEPRYASLIAIRRASKKEIKTLGAPEMDAEKILVNSHLQKLFLPPVGKRAEILAGSTEEVTSRVAEIIKEKGLI